MKPNKKAVIYCRVATDSQEGMTLENQEKMLRDLATKDGYEPAETIKEIESGINPSREGFKKLVKLIRQGKVKTLYLLNPERISRKLSDLISFQKLADKYRVKIVTKNKESVSENTHKNL